MPDFVSEYKRESETFCVIIKFETLQSAVKLADQVTEWARQWVIENKEWNREDTSVVSELIEKQPMDYFEIFTAIPYIIKAENNQLWLRLDGIYSYWWRDWGARIVVGLTHALPELGQYSLSFNCD